MHRSSRCTAHNRRGEPCQRWAIAGGTVCPTHGGSIAHVKARAEDRMRALEHPALDELAKLIRTADSDAVRLSGIKYVLDWCGFKSTETIEIGDTTIRVVYDQAAPDYLTPVNGHAHP